MVKCFTARLQNRAVAFKGNFRLNNIHKIITNFVIHLCEVIVQWGELNRKIRLVTFGKLGKIIRPLQKEAAVFVTAVRTAGSAASGHTDRRVRFCLLF